MYFIMRIFLVFNLFYFKIRQSNSICHLSIFFEFCNAVLTINFNKEITKIQEQFCS